MLDLFCGRIAAGEKYNLTRDRTLFHKCFILIRNFKKKIANPKAFRL